MLKYSYSFWVSQIIIGTGRQADGWHARVEEFVMDLLDTSGLVFFLLFISVSILMGGNGNGNDELRGANVRVIDRITIKSKPRPDHI